MAKIIDVAVAAGGFKTFVAAVQKAGLVEKLESKGPFTIFAPDDRAFSLLPEGSVDELMNNAPKLKAVLMFHIVPGKYTVNEIGQMKSYTTMQGQDLKIDGSKWHLHMNPVINNDAHIVNTDVVTDNGIVQVVDRVLMPNMELTCPVCGMGFMNIEALNAHTKMGHEPMKAQEAMPMGEKAAEALPPTEAITQPMPEGDKEAIGNFEVFCDVAGRFRFHLKAANGQIIGVSQSYGTKEAALKGIASIKKNAPVAKIIDQSTAVT